MEKLKIYLDSKNKDIDNFDYTEWQKTLWKDKSIDEIHEMATKYEASE